MTLNEFEVTVAHSPDTVQTSAHVNEKSIYVGFFPVIPSSHFALHINYSFLVLRYNGHQTGLFDI